MRGRVKVKCYAVIDTNSTCIILDYKEYEITGSTCY